MGNAEKFDQQAAIYYLYETSGGYPDAIHN
jgi:hypothetical protein